MHIHSLLLGCPECWQSRLRHVARRINNASLLAARDRKSTRLNSSHLVISYAVFCLKKKKTLLPTPISAAWGATSAVVYAPLPPASPAPRRRPSRCLSQISPNPPTRTPKTPRTTRRL